MTSSRCTSRGLSSWFEEPDDQPFDPATRFECGIDEVIERLGEREYRDARRLVVVLPVEQVDDQASTRVAAAIESASRQASVSW